MASRDGSPHGAAVAWLGLPAGWILCHYNSAGGSDPCDTVDVIRSNTTGADHMVT